MSSFRRLLFRTGLTVITLAFLFGTPEAVETNATPLQSLFMIKQLVPTAKTIGLMWTDAGDNNLELMTQITRASATEGTKVIVENVGNLSDVAAQFRDLTDSYHIQVLWIAQNVDLLSNSISKSYLIKNSAVHGIPLFAPNGQWVSEGACAAVVNDGGSAKLVVNQKTLSALGLKVPDKFSSVTQVVSNN